MTRPWGYVAFAAVVLVAGTTAVGAVAGPTLDKAKLEAYLRYAEGFVSNVRFAIDDPVATPFAGFYQVNVHLTIDNGGKLDRTYFLTADGKQLVGGPIWNLNQSPFAENLAHLPSDGYSFGPPDAKVRLVIFSDFQCPYCREFAKTVRDNIPQKYANDVRVTFEDFPLDAIHPWARAAAEASRCVGIQNADAFWTYHDWIFAHATEIRPENLREKVLAWAKDQKLDDTKLASCIDTHATAAEVKKAEESAKALKVLQTPTTFVDGRMIPGALPWNVPNAPGTGLDSVIQLELKRPDLASGALAKQ
jgi:protein-disulfide isomerase